MKSFQIPRPLAGASQLRRGILIPLALLALLAAMFAASSVHRAAAATDPDLTVSVTAPSTVLPSTNFDYTVTLSNAAGSDTASGANVQFTLPSNVTYVSSSITAGGFTGSSQFGNTFIFWGATLAGGSSATATVTVTSPASGSISSNAGDAIADPFHAITESDETNNNSEAVTTTVGTPPPPSNIDLQVDVSGPSTVLAGDSITYNITALNTGTTDATGVMVQFTPPSGYSVSGGSGDFGAGSAFFGTWIFSGSITHGDSASMSVTVDVPVDASGTITLPAGAVVIDPFNGVGETNETNNSSTTVVNTTVTPLLPDLTVGITGPATEPANVGHFAYTITASNTGNVDATDIGITFQIPNGLTYDSADSTLTHNFTASTFDHTITLSGGSLDQGDSATLTIAVNVPNANATYTVASDAVVIDPTNAIAESNENNNSAPTAPTTVVTSVGTCTTTCYVDGTNGSNSNSGTSPSNALQTISTGISYVNDGGTVIVAAGTYQEASPININHPMHLQGAGASSTIIQAPTGLPAAGSPNSGILIVSGGTTASPAEINGFTIQGPGSGSCGSIQAGIFVEGGAVASIHDNTVAGIADSPVSGCQNADGIRVGFYYENTGAQQIGTATISNNKVTGYQKRGIVVDGPGSSATISNNTVTGVGETTAIGQNGIEVLMGADATITKNTVSGNECDYSGGVNSCGADITNVEGGIEQAAGIELFLPGDVTVQSNTISNNDQGIYTFSDGSYNDVVFTSTPVIAQNTLNSNRYEGIVAVAGQSNIWGNSISYGNYGIVVFPEDYDAGFFSPGSLPDVTLNANTVQRAINADIYVIGDGDPVTVDITNNKLYQSAAGILITSGVSDVTIENNTLSSNTTGIQVDSSATTTPTIKRNNISYNSTGVSNAMTTAVDATCNWWGAATGPAPFGTGNGTSGSVTVQPWLTSSNVQYALCDTTAPTIHIYKPADGATYKQGAYITPTIQCTDTGGSGISSSACIVTGDGDNSKYHVDTSLGSHSFTVQATDNAGNVSTLTVHYSVTATGY